MRNQNNSHDNNNHIHSVIRCWNLIAADWLVIGHFDVFELLLLQCWSVCHVTPEMTSPAHTLQKAVHSHPSSSAILHRNVELKADTRAVILLLWFQNNGLFYAWRPTSIVTHQHRSRRPYILHIMNFLRPFWISDPGHDEYSLNCNYLALLLYSLVNEKKNAVDNNVEQKRVIWSEELPICSIVERKIKFV